MSKLGRWIATGFGLIGAIFVAVGFWLPWLVVESNYAGPVPSIYIYGMETGVTALERLLLAVVVVAFGGSVRFGTRRLGRFLVLGAGVLVLFYTSVWLVSTTGLDGRRLGVFVVGHGWFLTLLGSGLLAGGGWLYASVHRTESGS